MNMLPLRKQNRLRKFDYSQGGAYFLTFCSIERKCIFGTVVVGDILNAQRIKLSKFGRAAEQCFLSFNNTYENMEINKYIIMPNHIHLILIVYESATQNRMDVPANAVVPRAVSTLKRFIHKAAGSPLFQRSYHDHVIRSEKDYLKIWEYIDANPYKWEDDVYYTAK